jgi:hypothetical protein
MGERERERSKTKKFWSANRIGRDCLENIEVDGRLLIIM